MDTQEVGNMREMFAKFLDYVNDQAASAGLVSGLQTQVNELRERVSQLEQANYSLQQELNNANTRATDYQQALEVERGNSRRAVEHADALRHTIAESDSRVVDLTTQLTNERDSHRITTANLEDSRKTVTEYEQRVQGYQSDISGLQQHVANVTHERDDAQRSVRELQSKLDRVMSVLSPAIVTDVASVS